LEPLSYSSFKNFEPKFANARTKCESVIVKCIAQIVAAELRQELDKANFVSVTIDGPHSEEPGCWRA